MAFIFAFKLYTGIGGVKHRLHVCFKVLETCTCRASFESPSFSIISKCWKEEKKKHRLCKLIHIQVLLHLVSQCEDSQSTHPLIQSFHAEYFNSLCTVDIVDISTFEEYKTHFEKYCVCPVSAGRSWAWEFCKCICPGRSFCSRQSRDLKLLLAWALMWSGLTSRWGRFS